MSGEEAMSWSVHRSEKGRHLVLRATSGERLPESLARWLLDEAVTCGWVRASGVLANVELRAFDARAGSLGAARHIAGPAHVLALEGSVGLSNGEPSLSMRALLARESDRGLETLAGEITAATVVALEVLVTALDDVVLERAIDEEAGVWLLRPPGGAAASPVRPLPSGARPDARPPVRAAAAPSPAWSPAVEASEHGPREAARAPRPADSSPSLGQVMPTPPRLPTRPGVDLDVPFPEPGDAVDHFAFGSGDVVRSDGDRLHIRVHKDGRIREIALEMLRVTPLPDEEGRRRFKLERRM
jgi:predicted DNA-binding protein with PD1-like motif